MKKFIVSQMLELVIEAPSEEVAIELSLKAFKSKLHPKEITEGMSISNIRTVATRAIEIVSDDDVRAALISLNATLEKLNQ